MVSSTSKDDAIMAMISSEDCKRISGNDTRIGKIKTGNPTLNSDNVDKKTKFRDGPRCSLFKCFGGGSLLDKPLNLLNPFACLEIVGNNTDDDNFSSCSIPSKVYLTDSTRPSLSNDQSDGKNIVMKTTFRTVDTTLLSSQQSSRSGEFILLGNKSIEQSREDADSRDFVYDDSEILRKRSVSPLSCPSFGGYSYKSHDSNTKEEHKLLDIVSAASIIIPKAGSKDSLLSFDESKASRGSDLLLSILSMDSEDAADRLNTLNDICNDSVPSTESILNYQIPET